MNSKGPNNLSLNSYTQHQYQQEDNQQSHPSSSSYIPQHTNVNVDTNANVNNNKLSASVQQNFDIFVKQIRQRDQILHQIVKQISQLNSLSPNTLHHVGQYMDNNLYTNYGLNCRYQQDQEKKILAYSDSQISKVLTALQTHNAVLKQQIKGWNFQYTKTAMLTNTLLQQNKILRGFISKKNKDIVRLIQALRNTDNPQLDNLQQSRRQLKQQASILSDHGMKLTKKLKQKNEQQTQVAKAINQASLKRVSLKAKLQQLDDEEEHAAKNIVLIDQNKRELQQRQKYLLSQRARLKQLKNQYESDYNQIHQQIKQNRTLNQQHSSRAQMLTDLTHTRVSGQASRIDYQELVEKNRQLQQETRENENKLTEYSTQNRKLDRKLKDYQTQLQANIQKQRQAHQKQADVLSQIDIADAQIRQARQDLQDRIQFHNKIQMQQQNALKTTKNMGQDELLTWNKQLDITTKSSSKRIIQQQEIISQQSKQIQRIKAQIAQGNKQIQTIYADIRILQKQQQQHVRVPIVQQVPVYQQTMPYYYSQGPVLQQQQPGQRVIVSKSPTHR